MYTADPQAAAEAAETLEGLAALALARTRRADLAGASVLFRASEQGIASVFLVPADGGSPVPARVLMDEQRWPPALRADWTAATTTRQVDAILRVLGAENDVEVTRPVAPWHEVRHNPATARALSACLGLPPGPAANGDWLRTLSGTHDLVAHLDRGPLTEREARALAARVLELTPAWPEIFPFWPTVLAGHTFPSSGLPAPSDSLRHPDTARRLVTATLTAMTAHPSPAAETTARHLLTAVLTHGAEAHRLPAILRAGNLSPHGLVADPAAARSAALIPVGVALVRALQRDAARVTGPGHAHEILAGLREMLAPEWGVDAQPIRAACAAWVPQTPAARAAHAALNNTLDATRPASRATPPRAPMAAARISASDGRRRAP